MGHDTRARERGYVLHKGHGFDGRRIVVIATMATTNRKTGDMVQIWILRDGLSLSPVDDIRCGADVSVCGECPHRSRASGGAGTCYVNVGQAPRAVWDAYRRGVYPAWDGDTGIFAGRSVRFGAYGDPALIPADMVARIAAASDGWTGYTHAWRTHAEHGGYLMASVDSLEERAEAKVSGWRTFRVGQGKDDREVVCPASDEAGNRTTCDRCGLCAGMARQAKDVVIAPHGAKARRLVPLAMA